MLSVGAASFGGGSGSENFGSVENWILGVVTLLCCLLFHIFAKGYFKQLSVLFGLVVGYIVAICMHMVDFSAISGTSVIALPKLLPAKPEFNVNAIVSVTLTFIKYWSWIYSGAGDICNLSAYRPDCICRKLCGSCIYRRNHLESCTSEKNGSTYFGYGRRDECGIKSEFNTEMIKSSCNKTGYGTIFVCDNA